MGKQRSYEVVNIHTKVYIPCRFCHLPADVNYVFLQPDHAMHDSVFLCYGCEEEYREMLYGESAVKDPKGFIFDPFLKEI